jgi:hypothetical protein
MVVSRLGWCTCSREEDDRVGLQEEGGKGGTSFGALEGGLQGLSQKGKEFYQELKLEKLMKLRRQ